MKNKKFEIFIIFSLIFFSVILFAIYLIYNLYLETKSYTLILKPYGVLECKKWKCKEVFNDFNKYNNKEYNIFIDGEYKGINLLFYNSLNKRFTVFDKQNNNLYKTGNLFAYAGKAKITGVNYKEEDLSDSEIKTIKNKEKLNFDLIDALYRQKIILDFDNDGEDEVIYQFSSGVDAPEAPIFFDYVFYEDNERLYEVVGVSSEKESFENIGYSSVVSVLDIFDDGKLEIVIRNSKSIRGNVCNVIYRLKGKKFVAVNECEIVK